MGHESRRAIREGVPLNGLCLYPIVNHPGSNAVRGEVIPREQVQELAPLGRNPSSLAQLSPGVQYTPALASRSNRPFDNGGMDNFQISGGRAADDPSSVRWEQLEL